MLDFQLFLWWRVMQFIDLKRQYASIAESVNERIQEALVCGQFIGGPAIGELEAALAKRAGVSHVVGCSSGTDAALMIMLAYGVGPGDEVITPAFSFSAVVEMALLIGAKPVLVDVEADTCLLDPTKLEAAITDKTKLIVPVSLYGQCANFQAINAIARPHGIPVCEDAAQSFGALQDGQPSGGLSDSAFYSFYPSKPLGAYGDGGSCLTNDDDLAQRLRAIRGHGDMGRYDHQLIGITGRLDTIQAVVLLEKLKIFDDEAQARDRIGRAYTEAIHAKRANPEHLKTLKIYPQNLSMYAQYTVRVQGRDAVRERLSAQDIPTAVHYPKALHQQSAYHERCGLPVEGLPISERLAEEVMSLPMHPYLQPNEIEDVVQKLVDAVMP